jgi:hypothetical protein
MSEEETSAVLTQVALVEEKVDGVNVGLRFDNPSEMTLIRKDRVVNWNEIPESAPLAAWCFDKTGLLYDVLRDRWTIFGEWVPDAQCSNGDPPWFLFDIFDRHASRFLCRASVESFAAQLGLPTTPIVFRGRVGTIQRVRGLLGPSKVRPGPMEGLVLRLEDGPFLFGRFKFVRPGYSKI